jgi:hypothetical protein
MGSTDVIDLSSDEEEQTRPNDIHADFQDFKFLVPLASIRGDLENRPGIYSRNGTGSALLVKKEVEEPSTSSSLFGQAGSTSQNLSQTRPICRQFWKSGDYEVKKSADAGSQSMFSFFCFIASFNSFRQPYPHILVIQINNYGGERKILGFS